MNVFVDAKVTFVAFAVHVFPFTSYFFRLHRFASSPRLSLRKFGLSPNRYPFSCLAVAVIFCSLFISFIKSPSSINCVDMQRTRHDSGPASSRLWCLVKKLCAGFKDETFTICFKRKRTALRKPPYAALAALPMHVTFQLFQCKLEQICSKKYI